MRHKITVIGSLNYDIVMKMQHLPNCGETLPVDSVTFSGGGKGANQAVQAAKLGVDTCMVGSVGTDVQGDFLLANAGKFGVDVSHVRRSSAPSGIGVVWALEDGSVYASISHGANYDITREDIDAVEDLLQESELLILQMEIPQEINEYAIDKAKSCGCRVLLNAAPAAELPESYLKKCDILVVNEVEAAFYLNKKVSSAEQAEEGARELFSRYQTDSIITLGSLGAVVCENGETSFIPPMKVQAVETTGAGDSFIGGVGYALLQGQNLKDASTFASRCSGATVCKPGAQEAMPYLKDIQ